MRTRLRPLSAIASRYGYDDPSALAAAIWEEIVRTGALPFGLANSEEPNDESLLAIQEAEAIWASGDPKRTFRSVEEMMEAALEDAERVDAWKPGGSDAL